VHELTTCNYGLASDFENLATTHGLRVAAIEPDGGVRAIERVDHPFFLGTLYQPQLRSTSGAPHPVFVGLLRAAADLERAKLTSAAIATAVAIEFGHAQ
jgi:CTP synthase (UTP-ammonia lyase)